MGIRQFICTNPETPLSLFGARVEVTKRNKDRVTFIVPGVDALLGWAISVDVNRFDHDFTPVAV